MTKLSLFLASLTLLLAFSNFLGYAEIIEKGPSVVVVEDGVAYDRRTYYWSYNGLDFFSIDLSGHTNYTLMNIPMWWSFENVTDLNTNLLVGNNTGSTQIIIDDDNIQLINVNSSHTYRCIWSGNSLYQFIGWKEDSFKHGWSRPMGNNIFSINGDVATIGYDNLKGQEIVWETFRRSLTSFINISDYPICVVKYKLHQAYPEDSVKDNYWRIIFFDTNGNEYLSDQFYLKDYEWHTLTIDLRQRPTIANISSIQILIRVRPGSILSVDFDYIMLVKQAPPVTRVIFDNFENGLSTAWERNLSPRANEVGIFKLVNDIVFHDNNALEISCPPNTTSKSMSLGRELPLPLSYVEIAVNKINPYKFNSSEYYIFLTDGKNSLFYVLTDSMEDPIWGGSKSVQIVRLPCPVHEWTVFLLNPTEDFKKHYGCLPSTLRIGFQTYSNGSGNPMLIVDDIYVYPTPPKSFRELILDCIACLSPLVTFFYLLMAFLVFLEVYSGRVWQSS
jgi:hypothetical protein